MLRAWEKRKLFDSFFAPEAQRKLAGGLATGESCSNVCVPAGTQDQTWNVGRALSCAPTGARISFVVFPVAALRSATG
jgi:hypothetical protein